MSRYKRDPEKLKEYNQDYYAGLTDEQKAAISARNRERYQKNRAVAIARSIERQLRLGIMSSTTNPIVIANSLERQSKIKAGILISTRQSSIKSTETILAYGTCPVCGAPLTQLQMRPLYDRYSQYCGKLCYLDSFQDYR